MESLIGLKSNMKVGASFFVRQTWLFHHLELGRINSKHNPSISNRIYFKGKKDASVPNRKDVNIGKEKRKLLTQGLLKLTNSGGSYSNISMASGALHGREIKVGTKVQGAKVTLSHDT